MHHLYARVSTNEQVKGSSIPDQLRKCNAIASLRGCQPLERIEYVDEGVSGSTKLGSRPYGSIMLQSCRDGDTIIACKLDRLFRSASDALVTIEFLGKIGTKLILIDVGTEPVTEDGPAKFFFTMLSGMAEFERFRIRERFADGRRAKLARRGYMGGRVPFGYRVVGSGRAATLEEDAAAKEISTAIARLHSDGHKPGRIARYLSLHHPTASGKPWQQVQVERILRKAHG